MKAIERWKTWTFIGLTFAIAYLVNSVVHPSSNRSIPSAVQHERHSPPQPGSTPVTGVKSPTELAAEKAAFTAKHVKAGVRLTPGKKTVIVAVMNPDHSLNDSWATFLAGHIRSDSIRALPSAFTPAFTADGLLTETFQDAASVITKLELEKVADVLLLAREQVEYVQNDSSLANALTAKTELEIIAVPVSKPHEARTWRFSANGAGFKQSDALGAAEERLVKQIVSTNVISIP